MPKIKRFLQIIVVLLTAKRSPQGLRHAFEKLGSTFIKFGQMLSSRPDIVVADYANEFRELLGSLPAVSYSEIEKILIEEFGGGVFVVEEFVTTLAPEILQIAYVNEKPISTASIGQVHEAVLTNGNKVAIKVVKPGIIDQINLDIKILKKLRFKLELFPVFKNLRLGKILDEFFDWISNELDLSVEANRIKRFRSHLAPSENIVVPKVYEELTSKKVLTMEYLEGILVNDVLDLIDAASVKDPSELNLPFEIDFEIVISRAVESFLFDQILTHGYFHGDPHPANLLLLPGNKIAYLDFGIMGIIDKREHKEILMIILAVTQDDIDLLIKTIASVSEKKLSRKEKMDFADSISRKLHKLHGEGLGTATLGDVVLSILSISGDFGLHLSSGMVLAIKSIAQIEGIGIKLVPNTTLVELVKPHVRKYLLTEFKSKISEDNFYKGVIKALDFGESLDNISSIIGEDGIKVSVANNED